MTFEALHDAMQHSVRGKIRRMLGPSAGSDWEDVCQEIWLVLWRSGESYWNPKGVNLIARQVCIKWMEKESRSPSGFPIMEKVDGDQDRQNAWREPSEETSHLRPDVEKIAARVAQLPGEQRAVFAFRYGLDGHEELTFQEIAKRLEIELGQAARLFYAARRNVEMLLADQTVKFTVAQSEPDKLLKAIVAVTTIYRQKQKNQRRRRIVA